MLFAVHISDGILAAPWWLGGFTVASTLVWLAACRLRDEEIPRIALLTAAFFIASSIHVKVGPTSVHLLLNGLVGVLLGWRAALSIAVGLTMQRVFLDHGGYQSLGVNTCILTLPALLCGGLFHGLHRFAWWRASLGRAILVAGATLLWFFGAACSLILLKERSLGTETAVDGFAVVQQAFQPWLVVLGLAFAAVAVWGERKLENAPEFPLGLLIGLLSVLLTVALNALVLTLGGEEEWQLPVLILMLLHLPVAVIEGVILGFAVGFLARVKPELLVGPPRPPVGDRPTAESFAAGQRTRTEGEPVSRPVA